MGDLTDSLTAVPQPTTDSPAVQNPRPTPARDDCWSEEATFTLIEAWGRQFLGVNRGSLRQKHWQEVSDAVNGRHAHHNNKAFRTDVQCKNRIDTLKKKYKVEKARVLDSDGNYRSNWPYFGLLDPLIGSPSSGTKNPSPATPSSSSLFPPSSSVAMLAHQFSGAGAEPPMAIPLLPHRRTPPPATVAAVFSQKRPSPVAAPPTAEFSNIRNNYSTVAAAAAAVETDEDEDEEDLDEPSAKGEQKQSEGLRKLATAIERFGKVYARIEEEKQKQMVELEKQRMQFTKELECQRMQMLVEMQVQLEKVKRVKRSH